VLLLRLAVKNLNFTFLLSVPNSSSCVLFSTFIHFAGTISYSLQDCRCVKYMKPIPSKIDCNVFTCVPLYSGVQLLKDRHVQVYIVIKDEGIAKQVDSIHPGHEATAFLLL